MRSITIVLLLSLPLSVKGQVFDRFDLFILTEIARTDSYGLMDHYLSSSDISKFKFIDSKYVKLDSSSRSKNHTVYKFSDGKNQNISFYCEYDFISQSKSGWIEYELLDEKLYDGFKTKMMNAKMDLLSSERTEKGVQFWMWGYANQQNAQVYLRFKFITVFKEKWGYRIEVN